MPLSAKPWAPLAQSLVWITSLGNTSGKNWRSSRSRFPGSHFRAWLTPWFCVLTALRLGVLEISSKLRNRGRRVWVCGLCVAQPPQESAREVPDQEDASTQLLAWSSPPMFWEGRSVRMAVLVLVRAWPLQSGTSGSLLKQYYKNTVDALLCWNEAKDEDTRIKDKYLKAGKL